jgi:SAM-dependent methyltransferase
MTASIKDSNFKNSLLSLARVPYRFLVGGLSIRPSEILSGVRGLPAYVRDYLAYVTNEAYPGSPKIRLQHLHPRLGDRYQESGRAKGDYFHQDLWMAKKILAANPATHWDIGSRVDGFISHLLTFRAVNVLDVRKLESKVPGLTFHEGDITSLAFADASIESMSCLHTVEHIGLGRYGDQIDPQGSIKAMAELQRIIAPGGRLYFSVPIGRERIEFNAHRVFSPATILAAFSELKLLDFAVVNADGDLVESVSPAAFETVRYACGLFVFGKD